MNNARRPRAPPQRAVDGAELGRAIASPGDWSEARGAGPELRDQIEIWVNEGGAGGEADR